MSMEDKPQGVRIRGDIYARNIKEAIELQKKMALYPRERRPLGPISRIAGADVSFYPGGREHENKRAGDFGCGRRHCWRV